MLLPERLLIVDTETTDLDPQRGRCILNSALSSSSLPARAVLAQMSTLLPRNSNPGRTDQSHLCRREQAAHALLMVAHNAAFDRQWFGRPPLPSINLPWLCSIGGHLLAGTLWFEPTPFRSGPCSGPLGAGMAAHRALSNLTHIPDPGLRALRGSGAVSSARVSSQRSSTTTPVWAATSAI